MSSMADYTIAFLVVTFTIFTFINADNKLFTCILLAEDRHKDLAKKDAAAENSITNIPEKLHRQQTPTFTDPSNFDISIASFFKYKIQIAEHSVAFLSLQKRNRLPFNT